MTLGPTLAVRRRWLSEPFLSPDDGSGSGGGNNGGGNTGENGNGGENKNENQNGNSNQNGNGGSTGTGAGNQSGNKGKTVTVEIEGVTYVVQDHVNKLVGDARNEGKQTGRTEYEQELKNKELTDQQQFKPLYEQEKEKREAAEARIADMELAAIRSKVGTKYNLPQRLIDRLIGKNEAEIEADAKEVARELGDGRKPVDTEGGNGSRVRGNSGNRGGGSNNNNGGGSNEGGGRKRARPFAFQTANDVSWNRETGGEQK